MFRYFIFVLFLFISFISNKSISDENETSGVSKDESRCAEALSNKLKTFTLPEALKPFGASNIEIEKGIINILSERTGDKPEILDFFAVFTVNGQLRNIAVSISPVNDTFDSTIILRQVKEILGSLPESGLSQLHQLNRIEIEYRVPFSNQEDPFSNMLGNMSYDLMFFREEIGGDFEDTEITIFSNGIGIRKDVIWYGLGRIMALHNRDTISDQKWRDATLADDVGVSEYGDTEIAKRFPIVINDIKVSRNAKTVESFAEAFMFYVETNGGTLHPQIARKYAHRFKVLDEVIGVSPSEREEINEISHLFETQTNDLLEKFGLSAE